MQLVSKISNLCDHNLPTLQTGRQTDRRRAIPRPRICTKVHCAIKKTYVCHDYNCCTDVVMQCNHGLFLRNGRHYKFYFRSDIMIIWRREELCFDYPCSLTICLNNELCLLWIMSHTRGRFVVVTSGPFLTKLPPPAAVLPSAALSVFLFSPYLFQFFRSKSQSCGSVSEIFAIEVESCQKSRRILDVFSPSQILGGLPSKSYTHFITLPQGRRLEMVL